MEAKGKHIFIFLIQWTIARTFISFSHTIVNDTQFYYHKLSVNSSKLATIEYSIINNIRYQCPDCMIHFHIYTTDDDKDLKTQCHNKNYGQLRNENLHTPLLPRKKPYRSTTCALDEDDDLIIICHGKTSIQDFIPRNYAFSFGYSCDDMPRPSLKGLVFNISLFDQSNETQCIQMPDTYLQDVCQKLYNNVLLPNLIGDLNAIPIKKWTNVYTSWKELILGTFLHDSEEICYKHFNEILCHATLPQCDPIKNQIVHPCKEMCDDFVDACLYLIISTLRKLGMLKSDWSSKLEVNASAEKFVRCDYLPSKDGPIPCFYKPVTCDSPPNITSDIILNGQNENSSDAVHSEVQYSCVNESYRIEGENISTCMYSGQWSKPPRCVPMSYKSVEKQNGDPLKIVLPLLIIPLAIFIIVHLVRKCRGEKNEKSLTRIRQFDAFVCYDYRDNDRIFAEETLRIELEENRDPHFKLCIHRRDFQAACDIMWNIRNAITNSNSAIIVMSQNYIDSLWCKEEFEQCYMENMKDPAFKLFVIMLQPENEVVNTSEYMESFFRRKTYLEIDDPKLFKKIADYLTRVKQVKKEKKNNVDNNLDIDQEEQMEMLEC